MSSQTSPNNLPGIAQAAGHHEVETESGTSIIGRVVIIKTGRFTNHLARISSLMNNRYNLQVLTDEGKPNRKEDGSTRSTALVRGGFDTLTIPMPRMVLGSIHDADLPVVLAELNRKRDELNLTVFETASNTSSAASFTRSASTTPAPHLIGSPSSRSRLKSKTAGDEEEQKGTIEEGEESRNNLYWVEQGSTKGGGARYGYVCLWYGGTSVRSTDTIRVLPISSKIRIGPSSQENSDVRSSSLFSDSVASSGALSSSFGEEAIADNSTVSISSGTVSQNLQGSHVSNPIVVAGSVSEPGTGTAEESDGSGSDSETPEVDILLNVSPNMLRRARRSDLTPLDEDVVNAKYAHNLEQDHFRHFLLALLAFPEWDYPQRDSYVWPAFVLPLMREPAAVQHYLRAVQNHPLNNGVRPFYDVILFLLCAEHTGVLDEWDDELFAQGHGCTDAVLYLLESITDFRNTNEEVYRFSCRVAECYQAKPLPKCNKHTTTASAPAAFLPHKIPDQDLEDYLSQVHALRETHLRSNQLVEAPLNVNLFEREWELFNTSRASKGRALTAASSKYAWREGINEFIASSRRQNKKLTALYTVKHPSCATFSFVQPAALSTPSSGSKNNSEEFAPEVERLIPLNGSLEPVAHTPGVSSDHMEVDANIQHTSPKNGLGHLSSTLNGHIHKGTTPPVPVRTPVSFPPLTTQAASVTAKQSQDMIVVYSGTLELKVPLQYCRINSLPDDIALEILHRCDHDVGRALQEVSAMLSGERSLGIKSSDRDAELATSNGVTIEPKDEPSERAIVEEGTEPASTNITINRRLISTLELDGFHNIVNRSHNDVRKIHHSFNRYLAKKALLSKSMNSNISSLDKAVGPYFFPGSETASSSSAKKAPVPALSPFEMNEFPPRSVKEVLALYFLFYPGLDDEHLPLMTTFNAPLFRMWNNSSSIAASVMAYGNAHGSGSSALTGKKPQLGEPGYVPRGRPRLQPRANMNLYLPNRWPQNLPLIQHNMYWLSTSNAPCLCIGLYIKPKSNDVQLHMIIINSEARRILVQPRNVVPLNDDIMKRSNDERSTAFASALMQFAEWELENYVPATSLLRKWYIYPEFITQMLIQTSRWLGWRKQADRHARMATSSRRDGYLAALLDDYKAVPEQQHSARYYSASTYPWDDSPVAGEGPNSSEFGYDGESSDGEESEHDADGISGIESFSEREDESDEEDYEEFSNSSSTRKNQKGKAGLKRVCSDQSMGAGSEEFDLFADQTNGLSGKKRSRLSEGNLKNSRGRGSTTHLSEMDDERLKPPPLRSFYNLFWVPKAQLPAMYYDTPENRYKEQFRLIPICCVTYHYPITVNASTKGSVEPLKMDHLKLITDERTAEFTHALIEFARKENENKRRAARFAAEQGTDENAVFGAFEGVDEGDDTHSLVDASLLQPHELFPWPQFILHLVNQPSQWHSWRKKAERSGAGLKRHQYLKALQATQEEYDEKDKAERQALLDEQQQQVELAKTLAVKVSVEEEEEDEGEVVVPFKEKDDALPIRSHYNLFWLLRSNLPAIYYDTRENRKKERFMVLPINCSQYQYPTHVNKSAVMIEALSMNNLAHCTDDRTHEFTLALIEFAKWETLEKKRQLEEEKQHTQAPKDELYFVSDESEDAQESKTQAETDNADVYDWPDFILEMLNSPPQWTAWRKKAERSNSLEPKRTVYYRALVEDYLRLKAAATESVEVAEAEGAMVVTI